MRKIKLENDAVYHVYNRGLDKTDLFRDGADYLKFVKGIHYLNDINFKPEEIGSQERYQGLALEKSEHREELVDILAWCLMSNHYHLVLRQKIEKGIAKFMQRLGTGYTMYINTKYKRSGHVFQGTFKARIIESNEYFQHVTRYLHLNPLDIYDFGWKERGVKNIEASIKFISQYPWSSLNEYLNTNISYQLTSPSFKELLFTDKPSEYNEFLKEWMTNGLPNNFHTFQG
ncbi:MAG: transposase [bacterium]|nr:transposase [bacterium]